MADENKILTALQQLDVANDNHWTADGQSRIDTVKLLAGDATLTRADIDAAAPGFNRSTSAGYTPPTGDTPPPPPVDQGAPAPVVPAAAAAGQVPAAPTDQPQGTPQPPVTPHTAPPMVIPGTQAGVDADGKPSDGREQATKPEGEMALEDKHTSNDTTQPPVASGDPTKGTVSEAMGDASREAGLGDGVVNVATQAELVAMDRGDGGDADAVADLEEDLARAAARTAELREAVDNATAELAKSLSEEAQIHAALEAVRPRTGTMQAIQGFFAAQDADNEKTIAARDAITKSGVNLKELNKLVKSSPLDQAMSAA